MPQTHVLSHRTAKDGRGIATEFVCTVRDGGFDAAWIHVAGELDIAAARLLERALRWAEIQPRVVLDLRGLAFLDSAGLAVIIRASIRAKQMGRRLVLVRGCRQVDRVLGLTGATDVLEIVDLLPVQPPVQALVQLAHEHRAA